MLPTGRPRQFGLPSGKPEAPWHNVYFSSVQAKVSTKCCLFSFNCLETSKEYFSKPLARTSRQKRFGISPSNVIIGL